VKLGFDGRGASFAAELLDISIASVDVSVDLVFVIPIVAKGGMDLAEGEVRELEMQIFGAPFMSQVGRHELDNLHRRASDQRHAVGVVVICGYVGLALAGLLKIVPSLEAYQERRSAIGRVCVPGTGVAVLLQFEARPAPQRSAEGCRVRTQALT
jgi:hypothetical protein